MPMNTRHTDRAHAALMLLMAMLLLCPQPMPMDALPEEVPATCEQVFGDVPTDNRYCRAVYELSQRNVIQADIDERFRPDDPMTAQELAMMLAAAAGIQVTPEDYGTVLQDEPWYGKFIAKYKPEYRVSDQDAWLATLDMAGLPVFTRRTVRFLPTVHRGDVAVMLANALMFRGAKINFDVEYGSEDLEYDAQMTAFEIIRYVPAPIMARFVEDGWRIVFDPEYLERYRAENDRPNPVTGLTRIREKIIYVSKPETVVHELGHYLTMVVLNERYSAGLYDLEHEAAMDFIRPYSGKNRNEFAADLFMYYIKYRDRPDVMAALQNAMPASYAWIARLERSNWGIKP